MDPTAAWLSSLRIRHCCVCLKDAIFDALSPPCSSLCNFFDQPQSRHRRGSSSDVKTADLITILPGNYLSRPLGWEVGRTLHLNARPMSLADIASLIFCISSSAELYRLFKQNCYWFPKTIFDAVLQEFNGDDIIVNSGVALGCYRSVSTWTSRPEVLEEIISAWNGKIETSKNIKSSLEVRMICLTVKIWQADTINPKRSRWKQIRSWQKQIRSWKKQL